MTKRKTHFEQVPLEVARKIAAEELKRKEARLKKAGSKRKTGGLARRKATSWRERDYDDNFIRRVSEGSERQRAVAGGGEDDWRKPRRTCRNSR